MDYGGCEAVGKVISSFFDAANLQVLLDCIVEQLLAACYHSSSDKHTVYTLGAGYELCIAFSQTFR